MKTAHEDYLTGCLLLCAVGIVISGLAGVAVAYETRHYWQPPAQPPVGYRGDPQRGSLLVSRYGCASCHELPRHAPKGQVGPTLNDIGRRTYIAGRYPNDEIWMTTWLENPQRLKEGTAMPNLNIGERDARDMAAYLATLR